jgi:hypothetical protein
MKQVVPAYDPAMVKRVETSKPVIKTRADGSIVRHYGKAPVRHLVSTGLKLGSWEDVAMQATRLIARS